MTKTATEHYAAIFRSRLNVLRELLEKGEAHAEGQTEAIMEARLAPDMLPFPNQVVFACFQVDNFVGLISGRPVDRVEAEGMRYDDLKDCIAQCMARLDALTPNDAVLDSPKSMQIGETQFIDFASGRAFVEDFLQPNFYFHMTTTYALLRMQGVPIGKVDFMTFLLPQVRHA